jgi:hypothetical protein
MKRLVAAALLLLAFSLVTTGFLLRARPQNMVSHPIRINSKALSEEGLTLISPSDADFDRQLASLKDEAGGLRKAVDANRLLCVFLKNSGRQTAVAYVLKWEFQRANGTVLTRSVSYGSPGAFGGPNQKADSGLMGMGDQVPAQATRLVSLDPSLSSIALAISGPGKASRDGLYRALEGYVSHTDRVREGLLESVASVTVSLDGVFFEDGTFVGPDTTNFFAEFQAEIDAQRDVAQEVGRSLGTDMSAPGLAKAVEGLKNARGRKHFDDPRVTAHYDEFVSLYADEYLSVQSRRGVEGALEHGRRQLEKQYPVLRKKADAK